MVDQSNKDGGGPAAIRAVLFITCHKKQVSEDSEKSHAGFFVRSSVDASDNVGWALPILHIGYKNLN